MLSGFSRAVPLVVVAFAMAAAGLPARSETALVFNTAANAPFHEEDGTGFIDLVMVEIGGRIGRPIHVAGLPPERAIQDANSGGADGDAYRIAGLDRQYPNLVQVPESIADMRFAAFSIRRDIIVKGWNDFDDLAVAYITGWKIFEVNVKKAADISTVRNANQLFRLVQRGRADVALYDLWQGSALLSEVGWKNIKPIDPPLAVMDMYLYVNQTHRDLVPAITAALRDMKADGSYQAIFDQVMKPLLYD